MNAMIKMSRDNQIINIVCAILYLTLWLWPMTGFCEENKPDDLPKEAIKALYMSQKAIQEDNLKEAATILNDYMNAATTAVPAEVYLFLGGIYYEQGDMKQARIIYQKGYESNPKNGKLLLNCAVLNYESENFVESGRLFEKLYRLNQDQDKKFLMHSAVAFYQGKDLAKAKSLLIELVTGPNAKEHEEKGFELIVNICLELEQWSEVEKWVTAFLEIKPDQAKYWRMLAQIRLDRQQYREAASILEIAYRLELPKDREWRELGDLYLYLGAPLMAARCFKLGDGKDMSEKEHLQIAKAYSRSLRFNEAIAYLDKTCGNSPDSSILYEKGRLLYEAGRFKEAMEVLKKSTELDKKKGEAYMLMGFINWTLEDWQGAKQAFADAAKLPEYQEMATDAKSVMENLLELQEKQ